MSAGQQRARQLVAACLREDEQRQESIRHESRESRTSTPVLITIPSICDKELDLAIKSISDQELDENIFDLPDSFIADCSINNTAEQIIVSNNAEHVNKEDIIVQENLSPNNVDNNTSRNQDFDSIICNESQNSDDEMIPQHRVEVISALIHSPPETKSQTHNTVNTVIVTENIEEEHNKADIAEGNEIRRNEDTEDINFIPIEEDDEEEERERVTRPSRGRKRKIEDQNRDIRKRRCNTNQNYVSAKGKLVNSKIFTGYSYDCGCPRKCTQKIPAEKREYEFKKFWSAGSFEARCALLQGYVKESNKERSYSLQSKRVYTRKYYMCDIEICKKTLLNVLKISQARIDSALTKNRNNELLHDKRGEKAGGKNAITAEQLKEIRDFINEFPRYKSHYCRESSSANYLAPNLNLHILYDKYKTNRVNAVSFSRFRLCFMKDFNLKFKKPQKDTCLRCDVYKATLITATSEQRQVLENQHKQHLDHASSLRLQMKADLLAAKTNEQTETLTFDLEKTHSLPLLPTGVIYYKRQLNFYNLGIHCGSTGRGIFYVWLEHEAGRGTQEVGSCLRKFVKEKLKPGVTHLILWSDSCGGQNRSINMVVIMLQILQTHETLKKVTLRFLQPGHTFLPNDSEFGDVECLLKKQTRLYTADDLIEVMKNCRRKNKFEVIKMTKNDFLSIEPLQNQITNRKMNVHKEKVSWLKTHEIELRKSEPTILFMKSNPSCEATLVDIGKGRGRWGSLIQFLYFVL